MSFFQRRYKWCSLLPEEYGTLESNQIKCLEELRNEFRASHENLFGTIMSTAWAVKKAQYSSLIQAKTQLANIPHDDKDLWIMVLGARLKGFEDTLGEGDAYSTRNKIDPLLPHLRRNIHNIVEYFSTFDDEIKYALCLEKEAGFLDEPTGTVERVNRILGGPSVSKSDLEWYYSINNSLPKMNNY